MPGLMYLPPQENPWEKSMNQMGNLITQLAIMKVAQNFKSKEAEIEATRRETERAQVETAANKRLGAQMVLEGKAEQIPTSETVREGMPAVAVTLPGAGTYTPKEKSYPLVPLTFGSEVIGHYNSRTGDIHYIPGKAAQKTVVRGKEGNYWVIDKDSGAAEKTEVKPPPSSESTPSWQRKTRFTLGEDGKTVMAQEYDFNPKTTATKDVGKPYKAPKEMAWNLLKELGIISGGQQPPVQAPAPGFTPEEWQDYQRLLQNQGE